jgi:23S rRNA (guanosine2251-2'-O)-methyltransferase
MAGESRPGPRGGRIGRGSAEILVFGRRAVLEALARTPARVAWVQLSRRQGGPFRKELAGACRDAGVRLETVRPESIHARSGEPRHDQGVVAGVALAGPMEIEVMIASTTGAGAREPAPLIALDGITNPQNVGMIVRSVVASGMRGLLWPLVGMPWVNGLVVKASAATAYDCPIVRCDSLVQGLAELRGAGFRVVGLQGEGATDLFDMKPAHRAVYVIGGETEGISAEVAALLDESVRIPMRGGVESLNAAVAASLLCFRVAHASARANGAA